THAGWAPRRVVRAIAARPVMLRMPVAAPRRVARSAVLRFMAASGEVSEPVRSLPAYPTDKRLSALDPLFVSSCYGCYGRRPDCRTDITAHGGSSTSSSSTPESGTVREYLIKASATSLRYSHSARDGFSGDPSWKYASAAFPCSQSMISTRKVVPGSKVPIECRIRRAGPIWARWRVAGYESADPSPRRPRSSG